MKNKVLLAWVILLAIPLGGWLLHRHVEQCCDAVDAWLTAAQEADDPGDPTAIYQANALWQDNQHLLTTLVTHEEVDTVTLGLTRAVANFNTGSAEEYYAAICETRAALRIVRDFDQPTLRSIF